MTVINTNINAMMARNSMAINQRSMATAMEQLSTGSRINSAKDDAAGLAIADKMTSQIRGLDTAVRNANDGISLLQTAEGAMIQQTAMLQRMRELALQASSDAATDLDKKYLNNEFQSLKTEINNVGAQTRWNGFSVLDGSGGSGFAGEPTAAAEANGKVPHDGTYVFHVGANAKAEDLVTVQIKKMTTDEHTASLGTNQDLNLNYTVVVEPDDAVDPPVVASETNYTAKVKYVTDEATGVETASLVRDDKDNTGGDLTVEDFQANTDNTDFAGATDLTAVKFAKGGTLEAIHSDDISTRAGADSCIDHLDAAMAAIDDVRSNLGAHINQLTYAVDDLTTVSQNATLSRSRITDTDYALASSNLAKAQIIQQAATAMLAQANQQPQTVLALLK